MNDNLWMAIAKECAKDTTCQRRGVGACIVKNGKLISYGVNRTAEGVKPCGENGCERKKRNVPSGERHEICKAVHAEQNAIHMAAEKGIDIKGSTIYVTDSPCSICSRAIINAGISKVVYLNGYPDDFALEMIEEAALILEKFNGDTDEYEKLAKKTLGFAEEKNAIDIEPDNFGNKIEHGLISITDPSNMSKQFKSKFELFRPGSPIRLAIVPGINLVQMKIVETAFEKCFDDFGLLGEIYVAGIAGIDTSGTNRDVLLRLWEATKQLPVANAFLTNSQIEKHGYGNAKEIISHSEVMFSINTSSTYDKSDPFKVSSLDNPDQSIINLAHEQSLVRTFKPIVTQYYR